MANPAMLILQQPKTGTEFQALDVEAQDKHIALKQEASALEAPKVASPDKQDRIMHRRHTDHQDNHRQQKTAAILVGMTATLIGVGLARFAYTPLIPAMIEASWFTASQATQLAAANLLGYLLGAVGAHRLTRIIKVPWVIGGSLLVIILSFLLCAQPASFGWFYLWRLLSGLAGALLMVCGPSLALSLLPVSQRHLGATCIFMGIGLGIVLSAVLLPPMLAHGLTLTWQGLTGLAVLCGLLNLWGLCHLRPSATTQQPSSATHNATPAAAAIRLVILAYALDAAGFIPHTLFWVDYLSREIMLGTTQAAFYWGALGIGAVAGPIVAGILSRTLGWNRALLMAFGLKTAAVLLPAFSQTGWVLWLSAAGVGAMIPGIVALTAGRLAELAHVDQHQRNWGMATAAFAGMQALAGFSFAACYAWLGTYQPFFTVAGLLLGGGTLCVLLAGRRMQPGQKEVDQLQPTAPYHSAQKETVKQQETAAPALHKETR